MKKNILKINKKEIIIISVLIGILLIISFYELLNKKDNTNKVFEKEDYIIEKDIVKKDNNITHRLPYINLDNDKIKEINNLIIEKYYMSQEHDDSTFDYKYNQTGDILSLLINSTICEYGDSCKIEYYSYNLDLKNNKLLENEQLLKMYNYDSDIIEKTIKNKLNEYYNHELINHYIDESVTFEQYLEEREIENYSDISLYLDKTQKLKIYKLYTLSYGISIDEELIDDPFEFEIN